MLSIRKVTSFFAIFCIFFTLPSQADLRKTAEGVVIEVMDEVQQLNDAFPETSSCERGVLRKDCNPFLGIPYFVTDLEVWDKNEDVEYIGEFLGRFTTDIKSPLTCYGKHGDQEVVKYRFLQNSSSNFEENVSKCRSYGEILDRVPGYGSLEHDLQKARELSRKGGE